MRPSRSSTKACRRMSWPLSRPAISPSTTSRSSGGHRFRPSAKPGPRTQIASKSTRTISSQDHTRSLSRCVGVSVTAVRRTRRSGGRGRRGSDARGANAPVRAVISIGDATMWSSNWRLYNQAGVETKSIWICISGTNPEWPIVKLILLALINVGLVLGALAHPVNDAFVDRKCREVCQIIPGSKKNPLSRSH